MITSLMVNLSSGLLDSSKLAITTPSREKTDTEVLLVASMYPLAGFRTTFETISSNKLVLTPVKISSNSCLREYEISSISYERVKF